MGLLKQDMSEPEPSPPPLQGLPDRITKEVVNEMPLGAYEGPIHVINDVAQLDAAMAALAEDEVWGFDTETKPSFKRGDNYLPSLLQLANARAAYLFQLPQLQERSQELLNFLGEARFRKVGVALRDDIRKLQEIHPFQADNFYEIAQATGKAGIVNTGLRNLVAIFLGFRISKNAQVSNWAKPVLTEQQIRYAATDAWVSRELYLKLEERDLLLATADPIPPRPAKEPTPPSGRRRRSRRGRGKGKAGDASPPGEAKDD